MIYEVQQLDAAAYVGQQVDVFIDADEHGGPEEGGSPAKQQT